VIVLAIVSLVLTVSAVGLAYGTVRNLRNDSWAIRARDRFFGRWFRWFWLVAGLGSSLLLLKAAWLVWFAPLRALLFVLAVPLLAGGLTLSAKKVLPWIYERKRPR
jgi:hypothetical protein